MESRRDVTIPFVSRTRLVALGVLVFVAGLGCTATRVREFTRDVYEAPPARAAPARVFAASPGAVRRALTQVLRARSGVLDEAESQEGAIVARLPWASSAEAREAVDLGRVHRVISRTERSYRSWSPLHIGCDACVIEKGRLTGQKTELVEDARVALDADRYRLDARLVCTVETVRSGTRLQLALAIGADPLDPPELAPASTGRLESTLFEEIGTALVR